MWKILSNLHKYFSGLFGGGSFLTAFFSNVLTFSPAFDGKKFHGAGDVTCSGGLREGDYAEKYAGSPQGKADFGKGEIAVDNSHFSTFSTGFSTRVIHNSQGCGYPLWINIT